MSQSAKAQEPSMEEILASIRRIIADDDATKPQGKPAEPAAAKPAPVPPPRPAPVATPAPKPAAPPPPAAGAAMNQDDIDAMLAGLEVEAAAEPPPPPPAEAEILDLTEAMEAAPPEVSERFEAAESRSEPELVRPPAPASFFAEPRRDPPAAPERPLLSTATSAAVDSAFNSLAQTVLVQNARTLEDLVREMLRPMLKTWLDDNLPGLVERMVRAEIERVSRGRS